MTKNYNFMPDIFLIINKLLTPFYHTAAIKLGGVGAQGQGKGSS